MVYNMVLNSVSTILLNEYSTYSNFTRFSIVCLLQDPIWDCTLDAVLSYLLSFFQPITIPQFFLVFMTWHFWSVLVSYFVDCASVWASLMISHYEIRTMFCWEGCQSWCALLSAPYQGVLDVGIYYLVILTLTALLRSW